MISPLHLARRYARESIQARFDSAELRAAPPARKSTRSLRRLHQDGSLNDTTAEWTGGFFDASGKNSYVSIQHYISGYGTILKNTGWGSPGQGNT